MWWVGLLCDVVVLSSLVVYCGVLCCKLYNIKRFDNKDKNAESIIAYIKIKDTKTVLTGDANYMIEEYLNSLAKDIGNDVDVYKMPHHASDGAAKAKAFNPTNIVVTTTAESAQEDKMEIYKNAKRFFVNDTKNALIVKYGLAKITFVEE